MALGVPWADRKAHSRTQAPHSLHWSWICSRVEARSRAATSGRPVGEGIRLLPGAHWALTFRLIRRIASPNNASRVRKLIRIKAVVAKDMGFDFRRPPARRKTGYTTDPGHAFGSVLARGAIGGLWENSRVKHPAGAGRPPRRRQGLEAGYCMASAENPAPFQAKMPPGWRKTLVYPSFFAQAAPLWLRVHLTKPQ